MHCIMITVAVKITVGGLAKARTRARCNAAILRAIVTVIFHGPIGAYRK
jgi:hypothetical protein